MRSFSLTICLLLTPLTLMAQNIGTGTIYTRNGRNRHVCLEGLGLPPQQRHRIGQSPTLFMVSSRAAATGGPLYNISGGDPVMENGVLIIEDNSIKYCEINRVPRDDVYSIQLPINGRSTRFRYTAVGEADLGFREIGYLPSRTLERLAPDCRNDDLGIALNYLKTLIASRSCETPLQANHACRVRDGFDIDEGEYRRLQASPGINNGQQPNCPQPTTPATDSGATPPTQINQ